MADDEPDRLSRAERIFVRISVLQTILALAGMFTGGVALFAALNEADAVRKQQKASVLPDLVFVQSFSLEPGAERFAFLTVNNGIGPGRVTSMRVTVDGEAVHTWTEMLSALDGGEAFIFGQSQVAGRLVRSGETFEAFETTDAGLVALIVENRPRIDIEVCYCSVFEECWTPSQSVTTGPARVAQCPSYGPDQFLQ